MLFFGFLKRGKNFGAERLQQSPKFSSNWILARSLPCLLNWKCLLVFATISGG
jgi:hypothetical protein